MFIKDLTNNIEEDRSVFIYCHDDTDGNGSCSIIYEMYKNLGIDTEYIEHEEIDYTKNINPNMFDENDIVYFVDYSFSEKSNIEALITLVKNIECKVVWIDHHKPSLDLINSGEIESIKCNSNFLYFINTEYCATVLCYVFAKYIISNANLNVNSININISDIDYNVYTLDMSSLPLVIQYIDSYDTWKHNKENTIEFIYGVMSSGVTPDTFMSIAVNSNNKCIFDNVMCDRYVDRCINAGKKIKKYLDNNNMKLRSKNGFEFNIIFNDIIYHCYALNTVGNSTVFGDLFDEYDIVCPFSYNGKMYKYSLFTSKEDIECDIIAKHLGSIDDLGGGGHRKAAGFQTLEQILGDGYTLRIKKKLFGSRYKVQIDW